MFRVHVIAISISFIFGCFAAHFYTPPLSVILTALSLFILIGILYHKKKATLICICMIALLLGVLRITVPNRQHKDNQVIFEYPGQVRIEGVVVSDIESKRAHDRYTVEVTSVNGSEPKRKTAVLVYEPYPTKCVTGENIIFSGYISEPEDFLGSGNRIFRYKKYLQQRNIYANMFIQKSSCKGEKQNRAFFAGTRKYFMNIMNKILPAQEASLLAGLILGLRGSLSQELLNAFRMTGLIHIIVLSGYNVTLVAETVRRLFAWTPRTVSFLISLITVGMFVMLAGAQTAAIRAGSMATIALIARTTYREYDGIRALLIVATLMTLYNPDKVLFSVSFHMSLLATLGLLLFSSIFEDILKHVPKKFEIRQIISATLATQIFLLPYLAYAIGEISLIGIPANIIILPVIPAAMLFGSAVTMVGVVMPTVAAIISPLAYLPLHTIIFVAEFLSQIPNVTTQLPEVSAALTVLLTLLLVFIGYEYNKKKSGTDINSEK